jgi:Flp pilus assembly pilin Flp
MISVLNLWRDEEGQDLIEYSLLMAFVAIAVVGLFAGAGGNVKNVWTVSNNQLSLAKSAAS